MVPPPRSSAASRTAPDRPTTPEPSGSDRSKERILDAAERLMASRGFASTGIAAISTESGLPASSIYWHFESKQGLLAAVVERSASAFVDELTRVLSQSVDPHARLRAFVEFAISRFGANPPTFLRLVILLALDAEHLDSPLSEQISQMRERGISRLRDVLVEIYRGREVADAAAMADEAAIFAVTFCYGSYVMQRIGPERVSGALLAKQLEAALLAFPDAPALSMPTSRQQTTTGSSR